jgi:hypothetical protein
MAEKNQSSELSRTWFCVLNNPRAIWGEDAKPEDMVNAALDLWQAKKPERTCAGNYEKGDTGNEHMHLVLCDPQKSRFSSVQKLFPGIHIEPMKGSKKDAEDYISKKGRFMEKAHTVIVPAIFRGNIKPNCCKRKDLDMINELIQEGKTPEQIMDMDFSYRRYEKMIRGAFFRKRSKEKPPLRPITVYWHVGNSGSGKTYTFVKLCEQYGEDNVYMMSDYGTGGLDMYEAQPILFMDEFKGRITFSELLSYFEGYKKQAHCRFSNTIPLWDEVHVTSVYPPEALYKLMVPYDYRAVDEYEQLRRRLTYIVYHYKEYGVYKVFQLPIDKYIDYDQLKRLVKGQQTTLVLQPPADALNDFQPADPNDTPFPVNDSTTADSSQEPLEPQEPLEVRP